jgi:hypothetical protein
MNKQLKDLCINLVHRYQTGDIELFEEAVQMLQEAVEDYMDSHPRLKQDTTEWDFEQLFLNILRDEQD